MTTYSQHLCLFLQPPLGFDLRRRSSAQHQHHRITRTYPTEPTQLQLRYPPPPPQPQGPTPTHPHPLYTLYTPKYHPRTQKLLHQGAPPVPTARTSCSAAGSTMATAYRPTAPPTPPTSTTTTYASTKTRGPRPRRRPDHPPLQFQLRLRLELPCPPSPPKGAARALVATKAQPSSALKQRSRPPVPTVTQPRECRTGREEGHERVNRVGLRRAGTHLHLGGW